MSGQAEDHQRDVGFADSLQDALAHLHDPCYETPEGLAALLGTSNWDLVRREITRAIEDLKPPESAPSQSQAQRFWAILHGRYLQGRTQEAVAESLGISVRHLRRQQGDAVQWLASSLRAAPEASSALKDASNNTPWMEQVRQELGSLRDEVDTGTSVVEQTIAKVVALATPLLDKRGVDLIHRPGESDLMAGVPATPLRQVLLITLDRMTRAETQGQSRATATIEAHGDDTHVRIAITTHPPLARERPSDYLVEEILANQGGHAEWHLDDEEARATFQLHAVRPCRVLIVDDNTDLAHFYRRFAAGTPYQIIHKPDGVNIVEAVLEANVDIVVLDVMLPDVDGWELLTYLHQHHATRHVPVIVCTVVRAEELAYALGAAAYLAKPVRRAEFIKTLHQVRSHQQGCASG